jgi:DNA-binding MarR family transcriptional regulator
MILTMSTKTRSTQAAPHRSSRARRKQPQPAPAPTNSVDLSQLTALVGFCVRIAQLQVFEQFHRELWRRYRLHPGAYSALVAIKTNPGARPGALASALVVQRPNMTKLLDALERDGWLERRRPKGDGRSVCLFLTPDGERKITRIADEAMAMDAHATACLTASERRQLVALLEKVTGHLRASNERGPL